MSANAEAIPDLLQGIVPSVGSVWMWEPLKAHAREQTRVIAVRWNGEEVWVESEGTNGKRAWNELSRWVEATVLLEPAPATVIPPTEEAIERSQGLMPSA